MKPGGTWGHTATGQIFVPEVEFKQCPSDCHVVGMRGYRYTAAVVRHSDGVCTGWIRWTPREEREHELNQVPSEGYDG